MKNNNKREITQRLNDQRNAVGDFLTFVKNDEEQGLMAQATGFSMIANQRAIYDLLRKATDSKFIQSVKETIKKINSDFNREYLFLTNARINNA